MSSPETQYQPPEAPPADASPAARKLEAGMRVGHKYRLLGRVAVGGMGEVWRARNEATLAEVAVKVSLQSQDAPLDERFRREAKLASELSHRNVVRVFDLVEDDDGRVLLVMELLRGESLEDYLNEHGWLEPLDAVAVVLPVLAGLAQAHEVGIVHRDVKPANVFLSVDPDGHVTPKVIDFGIAKRPSAGSQTLDGCVLGTPSYMAPEQIRARAVDGRADVFSVAVVLYEAITGTAPFDAGTPSATLAAVLEREVERHPRIEPELWAVIDRALRKSAADRYASAQEMLDALLSAVGQTAATMALRLECIRPRRRSGVSASEWCNPNASTRVPAPVVAPTRLTRGSRSGWLASAAAAAVLSVVAGLSLGRGRPAPAPLSTMAATQAAAVAMRFDPASPPPDVGSITVPVAGGPVAMPAPAPAPSVASPFSSSASAASASSSSSRVRHAKPIGTVPGF